MLPEPIVLTQSLSERTKLAQMFREARLKQGVSQLCVSYKIGCRSREFLSRIERAERLPSVDMAKRLADALHLDRKQLVEGLVNAQREILMEQLES